LSFLKTKFFIGLSLERLLSSFLFHHSMPTKQAFKDRLEMKNQNKSSCFITPGLNLIIKTFRRFLGACLGAYLGA
jgi:hypothetical protein